jgi:hypothetical protein
MISLTSSMISFIEVNSCSAPSIFTVVMAAPWIEERRILLNEFPMVDAKPRSRG